MHLFLRSIGFSEFGANDEEKLVKAAIKSAINSSSVILNKELKRGIVLIRTSEKTGICIYGEYDGKKFKVEYYYPYLLGSASSESEEITIERHIDKESYAAVSEELKAGVTLIFYVQNVMEYLDFMVPLMQNNKSDYGTFNLFTRNLSEKIPFNGKSVVLSALSVGGMILLPISKNQHQIKKYNDAANVRKNLLAAAKKGDEDAIESLTIEDLDTYTKLSKRIICEDVFTIVDSSFMPCGVECDQYSVVGEIHDIITEVNSITGETIYIMTLECNDMYFDVVINSFDLIGEPAIGRRFKGQIWLQGAINF